jgi:cytochrome c
VVLATRELNQLSYVIFLKRHLDCRASAAVIALALHAASWADGDATAGQLLYEQKCAGCHAVDANRVGPAHRGVFGRNAGRVSDFAYSSALKNSEVIWNEQTLQAWLADPEKLIAGQAMYFKVTSVQSRQDVIAYLATLTP